MDIGGYWATFVSIVVGLGLADLLMNFRGAGDLALVVWRLAVQPVG